MGGPDSLTELVFLMVILKIPIVYLCCVVYHAIKSVPDTEPDEPMPVRVRRPTPPRPSRPHGGPARAYPRVARAGNARVDRLRRG